MSNIIYEVINSNISKTSPAGGLPPLIKHGIKFGSPHTFVFGWFLLFITSYFAFTYLHHRPGPRIQRTDRHSPATAHIVLSQFTAILPYA